MPDNRVLAELNDERPFNDKESLNNKISRSQQYLIDKIPSHRPRSSVDETFSLPSLKDLAACARRLPRNSEINSFSASQALLYVNDVLSEIDQCLGMAKILLAELESEDDVELFYEGHEAVEKVNKVVSTAGHLMTQLMNSLDTIKESHKDGLFKEDSLLAVANKMEQTIHSWNTIALTTKDIKQQIRIALEWKEIYQQILTGVESELNHCFSLVFTIEEKNHLVEVNVIDLTLLADAMAATPYRGKKKLPIGLSDKELNLMFLNLTSRLTPLSASFDILRIKVTSYIQEAKELFPSSVKSVTNKQTHLESEWRRLLTAVEAIETELVDNRWNEVIRKASKQIFEKLDALRKSIDSIKEENQRENPDKARKERATEVNLKLIQNITKSIALIDKATSERLVQSSEIYAMQSSLHKEWASISEEASKYSATELHAKKPSGGVSYESATSLLPLQTGKTSVDWRQSTIQVTKTRPVLPINPPSARQMFDDGPRTPLILSSPTDSPITSPDDSPTPAPKAFRHDLFGAQQYKIDERKPRPPSVPILEKSSQLISETTMPNSGRRRTLASDQRLSPNHFKQSPVRQRIVSEFDESENIPLSQLASKSYLLGTKSSEAKKQPCSPIKKPLSGSLDVPKRSSSTRKSSLPVARRVSSRLSKVPVDQNPNFTPLPSPANSSIPVLTSPRTASRSSSRQQNRIPSLIPKSVRKSSITPESNRRIVSGPADLRQRPSLSKNATEGPEPAISTRIDEIEMRTAPRYAGEMRNLDNEMKKRAIDMKKETNESFPGSHDTNFSTVT